VAGVAGKWREVASLQDSDESHRLARCLDSRTFGYGLGTRAHRRVRLLYTALMTAPKEHREIIFRQAGQPDKVVPLITPYIELPARIERHGRTWAYAEQEGERPIFRPTDEIEPRLTP
jgi:hypothetical protein